MAKTIKVEDKVYKGLQDIQRPRETYSQTVERLIALFYDTVGILHRLAPLRPDPTTPQEGLGGTQTVHGPGNS
jgi:predicted CopG family antitoxin